MSIFYGIGFTIGLFLILLFGILWVRKIGWLSILIALGVVGIVVWFMKSVIYFTAS